jgi:uncharacterized protein (TIGR02001 family)
MSFKTITPIALVTISALLVSFGTTNAQLEFSGDVTAVSTYVWRGIKQYNGPALQGTAGAAYGALSFGLWYSSVNFGDDTEVETDPYIEVSLPTGSISTSIGATVYSYDFFESFNDDADIEYEVFGKIGVGPIGLAAYYVPGQSSTENNLNESDYWIEVSAGTVVAGADLGAAFCYGTYSSKWLATPKKDAVSHVVLSAGRSISEIFSAGWNYSIALDDDMDNLFVGSLSITF